MIASCCVVAPFACAGPACTALAKTQVGTRHLQMHDVELKLSRLVQRSEVMLRKAGPGQRLHVSRAAKLCNPIGI